MVCLRGNFQSVPTRNLTDEEYISPQPPGLIRGSQDFHVSFLVIPIVQNVTVLYTIIGIYSILVKHQKKEIASIIRFLSIHLTGRAQRK